MALRRSLYWRIGLGFIAFVALTLAAQALVFLWIVSRAAGTLLAGLPENFASLVAADVTATLMDDPNVDLQSYVQSEYAEIIHPFYLVMADGRVIVSGSIEPPPNLVFGARNRLRWRLERRDGRRLPLRRFRLDAVTHAPIVTNERITGLVLVPRSTPWPVLVRYLGPTLAAVGIGLLALGTVLCAVFVFRPARRRLRALEQATAQLGAGDLTARAPEIGGDEIAAVAKAFNRMATDLTNRAEQIQAADRTRRQLLADVSHELTTPLTAIRGYLETLTMPELALDPSMRHRYLDIISQEAGRIERLVRDLVDLANLEGGGGTIHRNEVPVRFLFDRVAARHEREAHERNIAIRSEIGEGAEVVRGDPDRLEQALQNLAANALRHTPSTGVIELRALQSNRSVRLSVTDSGEGISPEHLPFVFDRFYKGDAARANRSGGSGLGLSIVKAIVERHGGSVSATSRPGQTVFELQLPLDA